MLVDVEYEHIFLLDYWYYRKAISYLVGAYDEQYKSFDSEAPFKIITLDSSVLLDEDSIELYKEQEKILHLWKRRRHNLENHYSYHIILGPYLKRYISLGWSGRPSEDITNWQVKKVKEPADLTLHDVTPCKERNYPSDNSCLCKKHMFLPES